MDGHDKMKKRGFKELKVGDSTEMPVKEQKKIEEEDNNGESVTCMSHGLISVMGRRRVMEDAVKVSVGEIEGYDFFAVYDGHGGSRVANACRDRMHQLVMMQMEEGSLGGKGLEWEKVMTDCFEKMDAEVSVDDEMVLETVGSTAVVVMVGKEEVVVANCGDSRAVLCRDSNAVALSRDHKPDRPDERERVEAAGGRIINWNGSRVLGVLATSRSIGDQYLKPYVVCNPEVTVIERTKSDTFVVLASDGLWDVVSSEFACEVVKRYFDGRIKLRFSNLPQGCTGDRAAEAATLLAELAMARGSTDNISVIVVELAR